MKQKPYFRAAVREKILELAIYEDIGENPWTGGGITAKTVKQGIDDAGEYDSITARINSPGGDAFEGVAIGNLLRSLGKPILVCIDGIAASAASIIAMAGDEIQIAKNAMMMIHDPWSGCIGNARDMRKMADTLDQVGEAIAQTYVERTGKPLDEVKSLLASETWMSAEDCLKGGFATAITSNKPKAMAMAAKFKSLAKMANLPEALKADMAECDCSCTACRSGDCEECSNPECDDPNCYDCPMQMSAKTKADCSNESLAEAGDSFAAAIRVIARQEIEAAKNDATPIEVAESGEADESEALRLQLQMMKARAA